MSVACSVKFEKYEVNDPGRMSDFETVYVIHNPVFQKCKQWDKDQIFYLFLSKTC